MQHDAVSCLEHELRRGFTRQGDAGPEGGGLTARACSRTELPQSQESVSVDEDGRVLPVKCAKRRHVRDVALLGAAQGDLVLFFVDTNVLSAILCDACPLESTVVSTQYATSAAGLGMLARATEECRAKLE